MKAKPGPKRDRKRGGGQKVEDMSVTRPLVTPGLTAKTLGSEVGLPNPRTGRSQVCTVTWGERPGQSRSGWDAPGAQEGPRFSICLLRSESGLLSDPDLVIWAQDGGPSPRDSGEGGTPPLPSLLWSTWAGRKPGRKFWVSDS